MFRGGMGTQDDVLVEKRDRLFFSTRKSNEESVSVRGFSV